LSRENVGIAVGELGLLGKVLAWFASANWFLASRRSGFARRGLVGEWRICNRVVSYERVS
jgi:hypothetical protein